MEANDGQKTNNEDDWAELKTRVNYCWICHSTCSIFKCGTCFRSFHYKCLRPSAPYLRLDGEVQHFFCHICISLEKSKKFFVGKESILDNLKHVKDEILDNGAFTVLQSLPDWKKVQYMIANPINLTDINHRIDKRQYHSLAAFLVDIECVYHNCFIFYGENDETTKSAMDLLNFCKLHVESISACFDCYRDNCLLQNDLIPIACQTPHLILLAKRLDSFDTDSKDFAPAKLMQVCDNDTIKVIFFCDSKIVAILARECYLYSTEVAIPLQSSGIPEHSDPIKKDMELYIKCVNAKFGRIVTNLPSTLLDVQRVNEHMNAMYPDFEIVKRNDLKDDENNANQPSLGKLNGTEVHNDPSSITDAPVLPTKRTHSQATDDIRLESEIGVNGVTVRAEHNYVIPMKRARYSPSIFSEISSIPFEEDDDEVSSHARIDAKILALISNKNHLFDKTIKKLNNKIHELTEKNRELTLERDKLIADAANTPDFDKKIDDLSELHAKAIVEINKAHDQRVEEMKMKYDDDMAKKNLEILEEKKYRRIAENFVRNMKLDNSFK